MSHAAGLLVALLATGPLGASVRPPSATSVPRAAVLVELFTSEGCSSCPPADALLRRLPSAQPIEGVEILGLGNRVDYWDHDGWRDPFSSALFSDRQRAYDATVFRADRVYTPQLVIDGAFECVASDEPCVRRTIRKAATEPKGDVAVTASVGGSLETITIRAVWPATMTRKSVAELVMALTEDSLETHVRSGEDRGRTLSHSAVVRLLKTVGHLEVNRPDASVTTSIKLDPTWKREHLRVVAFAQETKTRRIIATGAAAM
jgi:hypothetical protein